MIELAGREYAANHGEMVSSLFQGPTTCAGYYKRSQRGPVRGVLFMDLQKQPFAFAVQRDGNSWFVTASGKPIRYMFALCDSDAKRLGIETMSLRGQREAAAKLFD